MAQSANNESELNLSQKQRKRSISSKMAMTKDQLMEMAVEEIFTWDVETLDAALKDLNVATGDDWTKLRKARRWTRPLKSSR